MDEKVREDPEFKLDSIEKLLAEYEVKRFLVIPINRIRSILGDNKNKMN